MSEIAASESAHLSRVGFGRTHGFQRELRKRVDAYFTQTGKRPRDCWQMYVKTALILAAVAGMYVWLVFFAVNWWQASAMAVLLGLATACVGLNIQHDGGHLAFSDRQWVNRLMAMSLDLIGGSSYLWHWKHGVFHHTYTNITDHDTDVDVGVLGRLTPQQKHLSFHRWQHWYMWPLYGFMTVRWQLFGDFEEVFRGKVGHHPVPRPRGWNLVVFIGGKVLFCGLAFVVPILVAGHAWWKVLICYCIVSSVMGVMLAVVFQLAHCVGEAEFPEPVGSPPRMENEFAIHQVETTVDFARSSRLAAFFLGGLNYQVEHHLFPRICHIHYPQISKIVEATCAEYGVRFNQHQTFLSGVVSHFRWLRVMGRAPAAA